MLNGRYLCEHRPVSQSASRGSQPMPLQENYILSHGARASCSIYRVNPPRPRPSLGRGRLDGQKARTVILSAATTIARVATIFLTTASAKVATAVAVAVTATTTTATTTATATLLVQQLLQILQRTTERTRPERESREVRPARGSMLFTPPVTVHDITTFRHTP